MGWKQFSSLKKSLGNLFAAADEEILRVRGII